MIQFNKVSKIYPSGYEALSNLSFDLDLGEMVFFDGPLWSRQKHSFEAYYAYGEAD